MAYCERCGRYCADNQPYCRRCYFKLGQPSGMVAGRGHKCRRCGAVIYGRYNYCMSCAKIKGFIKNSY